LAELEGFESIEAMLGWLDKNRSILFDGLVVH